MATKKPKRHAKPRLRNAAAVARLPTPRAARAGARTTDSASALLGDDTTGWQAVKVAGGALGAALACAVIARQDWLPPTAITGATAAVGAALAVAGHSDTVRSLGAGAMAAAGGQFGLLLIDDHYQTKQATTEKVVSSPPSSPPKKPSNADGLPPGALEKAYDRALRRMQMSPQADYPM